MPGKAFLLSRANRFGNFNMYLKVVRGCNIKSVLVCVGCYANVRILSTTFFIACLEPNSELSLFQMGLKCFDSIASITTSLLVTF